MTYKFTADINKALRVWLKVNGFTCACRFGRTLCYDPDEENRAILVPREFDLDLDDLFLKQLTGLGYDGNTPTIVLDFLHEVGHSQTYHLFTEAEIDHSHLLKSLIFEDEDVAKCMQQYWGTPIENAANLWVVMYVKAFPHKVAALAEILCGE